MISPDVRKAAQHTLLYALERQEALDGALTDALGEYRWDLELAEHRIRFSSEDRVLEGRADLLASVAARPATLLWGWSPQMQGLVGADPAAQRLREHGLHHDLPALATEEVEYTFTEDQDQGDVIAEIAHDVGRIGLEVFGPDALYYTFPIGGGSRGCVLVRDLPVELPPVRIEAIATALGRAAGLLDDIGWAFDGLARMVPGWRASVEDAAEGGRLDVLVDAQGRRLSARSRHDENGRLAELQVRIEGGTGAAPDAAEPAPVGPETPPAAADAAPATTAPGGRAAAGPAASGGGLLTRIKRLFRG